MLEAGGEQVAARHLSPADGGPGAEPARGPNALRRQDGFCTPTTSTASFLQKNTAAARQTVRGPCRPKYTYRLSTASPRRVQMPLTHTRGHSTRGRSEQSWQFSPLPRQVTRGKAKLLQQKLRRAHDLEPLPSAALRPRRSLPRTRHNRPGATDTGREGRRPSLGRRAAGAAEAARSSERDPDREDEPGPSAHLPAKPLLSCQRGRRARAPPPFPSFSGQENCTRPPKQNTDPRAQQDPKGQSTHVSCFHPAFPPPIPAEGPPVPCRTCQELLRRLSAGKTGGRGER